MLLRVLLYGILTGLVLELLSLLLVMISQWTSGYWLYRISHWPAGLLFGMVMSAGILFLRRTGVEIKEERIHVSSVINRKCFDLSQFVDSAVIRKTHIGSYSKYTTVKCCLLFALPDGIKRCRLHGFGEKDLERLLEAIRTAQAAHLTDEEKAVIVEKYEDEVSEALIRGRAGSNEFLLPASVLAEKETVHLRRISLLAAGVVAVVGLTDASAILIRHTFSLQLLYLTMLALALLMIVSGLYAGLRIRRRICAEKIVIDGEHLQVGRQYFAFLHIDQIRLTSPRKRNSSVFPVQRYMYVLTAGKTRKYWLGSEVSFPAYERLCRNLEQGMVMYPDKLRYM